MHYHFAENCDTVGSPYNSIYRTYFMIQKTLWETVVFQNHYYEH